LSAAVDSVSISGLSHLVVEVGDLAAARDFYRDVLGFAEAATDPWPHCGVHALLAAADGAHLVLAERRGRPDLGATGVHQAYGVGPEARARIADRLAALGVEVFRYKEDRPAEEADNFYFLDPAGNRVQLVAAHAVNGGPPALDHAAVQVENILRAERFYAGTLPGGVEHRVGWRTADYARARAWGDGKEDMAPGTRRWDKRYTSMVNQREVPRVNTQIFVRLGPAAFGIYLANQHFQEPPEEALAGTPRTAFAVPAGGLEAARGRLEAAGWPHEGPLRHGKGAPLAASLYFKDPGGNFLELAETTAGGGRTGTAP